MDKLINKYNNGNLLVFNLRIVTMGSTHISVSNVSLVSIVITVSVAGSASVSTVLCRLLKENNGHHCLY